MAVKSQYRDFKQYLNRGLDLVKNITRLRMVKCTVVGEGPSQGETQPQQNSQ